MKRKRDPSRTGKARGVACMKSLKMYIRRRQYRVADAYDTAVPRELGMGNYGGYVSRGAKESGCAGIPCGPHGNSSWDYWWCLSAAINIGGLTPMRQRYEQCHNDRGNWKGLSAGSMKRGCA